MLILQYLTKTQIHKFLHVDSENLKTHCSQEEKEKISRSSRHNPTGKLNLLRAPQASELALYAKVLTPFWLQDEINVSFMAKTFIKLPPKSEDHGFEY